MLLTCEPAATWDGLIDVIDGTGLGVPPPVLLPPQLGNISAIANNINTIGSARLRAAAKPIKHAPTRNTPSIESHAPIFPARSRLRDCPTAAVAIVNIVETD